MKAKKTSKFTSLTTYIPDHVADAIKDHAAKVELPISRIIAQMVDKTFSSDDPFGYDLTLPDADEFEDMTYADEGGKLLDFLRSLDDGMSLDMLMLCRHNMMIPDREVLLAVFADCLRLDLIEGYEPKRRVGYPAYPEGYLYYRIKNRPRKRTKRDAKQYDQYLRLKKKFEGED